MFGFFSPPEFQRKTCQLCVELPFTTSKHSIEVIIQENKQKYLEKIEFSNQQKVISNGTFRQFWPFKIPMQGTKFGFLLLKAFLRVGCCQLGLL